ncbi:flagellar biosynthesis protein FlhB [Paenibacillus pasadenensis]|uniref:Flagellar biosynthetic protein FlhB n=1 Tax=Paenibacillus pasadenensis TaxID=217090 RepID=A0A2N5N761_9BACL|nr:MULTISPECIES: flagellar biosynthesis protein FlhB [Paenibacillus]PLT46184.1 Flagellar biosynthesis protein FlhB [Paenibacillus pasadenensis]QGG56645.1 flagellar biosynthesis protein FlhB [Paenibacillus sp. B01]
MDRRLRFRVDLQLFNGEKTEDATPKKKQEARNKGQVAKTQELGGAFIILFVFGSFYMLGGFYKERIYRLFGSLFNDWLQMTLSDGNTMSLFYDVMVQILILIAPILLLVFIAGLIVNYAQIGFLFTGEPLKPDFKKLDPIKGLKNIFSARSLVEFLKSILKLTVVGFLVFSAIWGEWDRILLLAHVPVEQIFRFTAGLVLKLGLQFGALLIVIGVLDYFYQRYEHEKSLRMSKQDIKDEYVKTEGNPLIKGKIKERQRRMALQRMMQEVPKADVVITNPTHFAIAIKYEGGKMEAPVILAKGMDYVALRIKEIAKENGVMTMENRPLARALYDRAEIGDTIPADLFQAVAEVLAYVYKLKGRSKSS